MEFSRPRESYFLGNASHTFVCTCRVCVGDVIVRIYSRWAVVGLAVPVVYAAGLAIASPHQEYRFLLPCLPFLHMFLGKTVQHIAQRQDNCCIIVSE